MLCSAKPLGLNNVFYLDLLRTTVICLVLVLSEGCALGSQFEDTEPPKPEPSIDLPVVNQCDCDAPPAASAFDLAISAVLEGRLSDARAALEDYRMSKSPEAEQEAKIGLAFSALLEENPALAGHPDSAYRDDRAAIMSLALAVLETLRSEVVNLEKIKKLLEIDLAKREEALKRLRELTLGQPEE